MPFEAYAQYYDLLYAQKPYAAEAEYVGGCIRQHLPEARTILDLGCGSGAHAMRLAEINFAVTGVDRSREQLRLARKKMHATRPEPLDVEFVLGDICRLELGMTFDAVVSLFHVMSYQTGNSDLQAAIQTARNHLHPGGLFIFDAWYGPAVLSLKPETRVKKMETNGQTLIRIARPEMRVNENRVDVHYDLLVTDGHTRQMASIRETHCMRYLFVPEVDLLLNLGGFRLLSAQEWMTGGDLNAGTWNCCFIAQAVSGQQGGETR